MYFFPFIYIYIFIHDLDFAWKLSEDAIKRNKELKKVLEKANHKQGGVEKQSPDCH